MNSYQTKKTEWSTWSTLIFWGVVALTIFGWFAGFMELFSGVTGAIQSAFEIMAEFGELTDQMAYVNDFLKGFTQMLGVFEFLTFASWVVYLVGLYKFRDAQTTMSALAGVKAINNACWTGLVAVGCTMLAVWIPWLAGLIFKFIGWIIGIVSYFMFRSAFRCMESETGWNDLARRGASLLRKSANYNIWLQFMPIILILVVLIVGLSTFQSMINSANFGYMGNDSGMGYKEYIGLYIFIGVIFGLAILSLSILQLVYRIWGWNRVMRGAPKMDASNRTVIKSVTMAQQYCGHCGRTIASGARFCQECGTEVVSLTPPQTEMNEEAIDETSEEDDSYDDYTPQDNTNRNWLIGGIIGLVLIVCIIFMVKSCSSAVEKIKNTDHDATELISQEEVNEFIENIVSEETDGTYAEKEVEDDWNSTTTEIWEGSVDGKYKIEMTINRHDSNVWGSYMYLSHKSDIVLSGEWDDNNQLTLTESVDGNVTGQFIGNYGRNNFEGLWISADGEKEMPFSVTLKSRKKQ